MAWMFALLADDVQLKSGGRISGIVREERAQEIVVETAQGFVTKKKENVALVDRTARSVLQEDYDRLKTAESIEQQESP